MIKKLSAVLIFFALIALFVWWDNCDKSIYDSLMNQLDAVENQYKGNDAEGAAKSIDKIIDYFNANETFLRTFSVHKFADDFHVKISNIKQSVMFREDFHFGMEINDLRALLKEWYLESRVNLKNIF